MTLAESTFYVTGGTLRADAPSYVERQADRDLLDGLLKGEFCYVLTSRQMGKSSLMVRTAIRLREKGVSVVVLDLTAIGQNVTPEQWYDGLILRMGRQLGFEEELDEFWRKHERFSPVQRFMTALRDVVMNRCPGPIVLFVDESDTVRSLPFSTDEFFAAIRECYNRRTEDAAFHRLTFCLLGVATPSDLIRETRMTPFNIGHRIELNDFTEAEAAPLAAGLARDEAAARRALHRVLHWTGGYPYLTQRFCRALAEQSGGNGAPDADALCDELFFSPRARERDDNLIFVRERLLNSEVDRAALLDLYGRIRKGREVLHDETNPLVSILALSGITRVDDGRMRVRNRIYQRVFDRAWILANRPDAERLRQRAAFKRGMGWAVAVVVLLMVMFSLPLFKQPALEFALFVGIEGSVEVLSAGKGRWLPVRTNQTLLPGDRFRTLTNSRALLRLSDRSQIRVGAQSEFEIQSQPRRQSAFDLLRGHILRRDMARSSAVRG